MYRELRIFSWFKITKAISVFTFSIILMYFPLYQFGKCALTYMEFILNNIIYTAVRKRCANISGDDSVHKKNAKSHITPFSNSQY